MTTRSDLVFLRRSERDSRKLAGQTTDSAVRISHLAMADGYAAQIVGRTLAGRMTRLLPRGRLEAIAALIGEALILADDAGDSLIAAKLDDCRCAVDARLHAFDLAA